MPDDEFYINPIFQLDLLVMAIACRTDAQWHYENLSAPYWRFYRFYHGNASIELDGVSWQLQSDRCFLIAPETPFRSHLHGEMECLHIEFRVGDPFGHIKNKIWEFAPIPAHLESLLQKAYALSPQPYNAITRWLGLTIAASAMTLLLDEVQPPAQLDPRILPALERIASFPNKDFSIRELATRCKLSDKNFVRIRNRHLSDPPHLYSLRAKTLKDAKLIFEWISRCFLQGDASIVRKKRWERHQKATSRFKVFNRNEYICHEITLAHRVHAVAQYRDEHR